MKKLLIVCFLLIISETGFTQIEDYRIYNVSSDEGLPTDNITHIFKDSYGFIWMASYEGLIRYDGTEYHKYTSNETDSNSISNNIVYKIFEDSKKRLWIGTIQGLDMYEREFDRFKKCEISDINSRVPVNSILEDDQNRIWLGTSFGLCEYTPESKKSTWYINDANNTNSLSSDVIFSLEKDKLGNIWIGTFDGGLNKFSPKTKNFTRYYHKPGEPNSISSNKIRSLLADHNNNIWIGTNNKGITLLSNDGNVLKQFPLEAGKGTPKNDRNSINCIFEDKAHNIWIGAEREPLRYLNQQSKSLIALDQASFKKPNLYCESVSSILEDSSGNLWFASSQHGIFYTNNVKNTFRHYFKENTSSKELRNNTVISFYEASNGIVWIGTDGGGLSSFDPETKTFKNHSTNFGSKTIYDIKEDKNGNLWLATWSGGIIRYNPKSGETTNFINESSNINSLIYNNVKSILIEDSVIWIGTHGQGLCVYNFEKNTFIHHKNNKNYPFNMQEPTWINHLFKDSRNRIWISTYSGVYLYDRKKLIHFLHTSSPTSISSNSLNMISEDGQGRIWIISESGALDMFSEENNTFERQASKLDLPQSLKAISIDNQQTIWLSSNEGLISWNPGSDKVQRFDVSDGIQGNSFFHKAVLRSKSGDLYFGGTNGFNVFHPDSIVRNTPVGPLYFTSLSIYGESQNPYVENSPLKKVMPFTDTVTLTYKQSFFTIGFTLINYFSPSKTKFAYKLEGLHDNWVNLGSERKVSFTNLEPGNYKLLIKYTDVSGQWANSVSSLSIVVLPPWYNTWWFKVLLCVFIFSVIVLIFYMRVASIKRQNKILESQVRKRTTELSEANNFLVERNEEIKLQNERLEEYNQKVLTQSEKILTQQKHIVEQNHLLEKTVQELKRSNQTKDRFFSILAHDLKNPVAAITGIAESLDFTFSRLSSKDIHSYIKDLHKTSQGVYNLLINLLNWSKAQSNNLEHFPTYFPIIELIDKNVALAEQQLLNKRIDLNRKIDSNHFAYVDYNMLDTVIRNILSNSIKFTYAAGNIWIESEETDQNITITISDDGMGMSEEQLESIFNENGQSTMGTGGESGTGLGLLISKEFIQANGGTIQVSSKKFYGTSFRITLPKPGIFSGIEPTRRQWESPVEQLDDPSEEFGIDKLLKVKGKKILIVDDNEQLRKHLKLMLSDVFDLHEASNGQEAFKLAVEIQPFAIITDLIMPEMDGIEFCRQLKNNTSTSHIPIILLTSQADEENQIKGYGAGAEVYLTKPVKKRLVMNIILNFQHTLEVFREKITNSDNFIPEDIEMNKADEDFLNKVIELTLENLSDQNFDYKTICEGMNISRTVLYNKIKTYTGQGVHEFVKEIRLKKSLKLLTEGKLSISQIAFEVGFNSHSYFNKCFTKKYKMAPKDFMKKKKKGVPTSADLSK